MASSNIRIMNRITMDNEVVLNGVAGLQCSWELSGAGLMTFSLPLRDLQEAGLTVEGSALLTKWILYNEPAAGTWGGQITNVDGTDGEITVTAESWASCLRGVTTESNVHFNGVAQGLVWTLDRWASETGIKAGNIDPPPSPERMDENFFDEGQDIFQSFLPSVLDYFAEGITPGNLQTPGYRVDPDTRQINVSYHMGSDKSAEVSLNDGLHNGSPSGWADDLQDVVNRIKLRAQANYTVVYRVNHKKKVRKGITTYTKTGIYLPSYNTVGPRTAMINTDKVYSDERAVQEAANRMAEKLSRNEASVTIHCTNENDVWLDFREGDIIGCNLSLSGRTGKFLVRSRALDVSTGVMTVSGEAELS